MQPISRSNGTRRRCPDSYILYYGTVSQAYSQQVDVGNNLLTTVNGLSNSTTYYFAVRAYTRQVQ